MSARALDFAPSLTPEWGWVGGMGWTLDIESSMAF